MWCICHDGAGAAVGICLGGAIPAFCHQGYEHVFLSRLVGLFAVAICNAVEEISEGPELRKVNAR